MTLPAVLARSPKGDAAIQGPPAPTLKRGDQVRGSLLAMTVALVLPQRG
ncbi:hypothetical protein DFR50_12423 [Roseiarcus fermentans]|uniref:Uncharacterized protein n=1 Tax=Roseiarcus fermentans TaxID=1473586 RepID=A0A366F218_9HYPH|nr:hypothetical protein DFR50_12423 [Roseiarcus fermentans]